MAGIVVVFTAVVPQPVQEHDQAFVTCPDSLCDFREYEAEARILAYDGQITLGELSLLLSRHIDALDAAAIEKVVGGIPFPPRDPVRVNKLAQLVQLGLAPRFLLLLLGELTVTPDLLRRGLLGTASPLGVGLPLAADLFVMFALGRPDLLRLLSVDKAGLEQLILE